MAREARGNGEALVAHVALILFFFHSGLGVQSKVGLVHRLRVEQFVAQFAVHVR